MQLVLGEPAVAGRSGERLWHNHTMHLGFAPLELIQWERMDDAELQSRFIIEGEEHLKAALGGNKGVMLLGTHLGNLIGLAPALGLRGYATHIASGPIEVEFLARRVANFVRRCGVDLLFIGDDLPRRARNALDRNEVFITFIDYSIIARHAVWVPVGLAEMQINTGPVIVALRHGTPVLLADLIRLGSNRHVLNIRPIGECPPRDATDHVLAVTCGALATFSRELLARPEQWWRWDYAPLRAPASR